VCAEIERLRQILSTYDPGSEIRRVMTGGQIESVELHEMLDVYAFWNARTDGAIQMNMGGVIDLWKQGAARGRLPDDGDLCRARVAPYAWNVDALGKGYVIDRAVAVARQISPGGLLNIGGDIRAWGPTAWPIAIADPASPAENAAPLATFELRDAAVATSGGYARYYDVAGRRFSHLIDPRTCQPCDLVASATVIADDCVTANALSTAACVLGAPRGTGLAKTYGRSNWIVTRGVIGASSGATNEAAAAPATAAWPEGYQVSLNLALKTPTGRKVKRPYVAVWVEDAGGKVVRTVTFWGKQEKYWREMTAWWQAVRGDFRLARSVTRATRSPGQYTIAWDGKDDAGKALPRGQYTLVVEINREHGRHVGDKIRIACQDKKVSAVMKATAESDESTIEYGPAAQ
jgi:thiamine biosynthesis lipoprotein ApbE